MRKRPLPRPQRRCGRAATEGPKQATGEQNPYVPDRRVGRHLRSAYGKSSRYADDHHTAHVPDPSR